MPLPPYFTFHRVLLERELQTSDDATRIVDLPRSNTIHSIIVKAEVTNGATSALNQSLDNVIDEIKVYGSASDVIYSLTPREIERWYNWKTGCAIPSNRDESASAVQWAVYPIMFGRGMLDGEYFLPMDILEDPKIHIKFSPTIAATAFVTGTVRLSIWLLMSMGQRPGQYKGTLSTRTIRSFTSAASGVDETLITRGNMIRQIMTYVYEASIAPYTDITDIKFSLNDDERVMYDVLFEQLQQWNYLDTWLSLKTNFITLCSNNDVIAAKGANIQSVELTKMFGDDTAGDTVYSRIVASIVGDGITVEGYGGDWTGAAFDVTADATDRKVAVSVAHNGLPDAAVLDFTKAGEGNLLDSTRADKVSLQLTQGGAGADVRVSTEEVRHF